ncbi:MAG TPA: ATP-binding protein, partial [Nanoarchaeota archaeon]|nr:ATP-binding protein [Nanoarchaeota archaeon]
MRFINREKEVSIIKNAIKLSRKKMYSIVITGLRRIGKTRLILESLEGDFLYFFIDENKSIDQLLIEFEQELKSKKIIEEYVKIDSFKTFLEILINRYKGVVVFDEFQNFYKVDKTVFGELQKFFDIYENRKNLLFIFSGSLVGLIKKLLSKKAPLYGRIKREIRLKPLSFIHIVEMCRELKIKKIEDILKLYFIFSGFPKYYVAIEDENLEGKSFNEIINRFFLEENAVLEEEVERILAMEFGRRKKTYYAILEAIANGNNTLSEIASALNLKQTSITRQLNELVNFFELVSVEKQIFGKKSLYVITHPLIDFWFTFFYKNLSAYKRREKRFIEYLTKNINSFFGKRFEYFIKENFSLFFPSSLFTKIGKQWGKIPKKKGNGVYEIDIVALNEQTKEIL